MYRLLGRVELPGFKVGGHSWFQRAVVDYWMDLRMKRISSSDKLVARAASLCRHPGFLDGIRRATSTAAVVTLVRETERILLGDTGATGR